MDTQGNPFQFSMNSTSAVFAAAVTIYYWWQNIKGIEESSDKALRVMQITTVMVVILLIWGSYSVLVRGVHLPPAPVAGNLHFSDDALGFLKGTPLLPYLGMFGILMAFGHSIPVHEDVWEKLTSRFKAVLPPLFSLLNCSRILNHFRVESSSWLRNLTI